MADLLYAHEWYRLVNLAPALPWAAMSDLLYLHEWYILTDVAPALTWRELRALQLRVVQSYIDNMGLSDLWLCACQGKVQVDILASTAEEMIENLLTCRELEGEWSMRFTVYQSGWRAYVGRKDWAVAGGRAAHAYENGGFVWVKEETVLSPIAIRVPIYASLTVKGNDGSKCTVFPVRICSYCGEPLCVLSDVNTVKALPAFCYCDKSERFGTGYVCGRCKDKPKEKVVKAQEPYL